jgi:hypothetical protein
MQPHTKAVAYEILKGLVVMQNRLLLCEGSIVFVFELKYNDLIAVVKTVAINIKLIFYIRFAP